LDAGELSSTLTAMNIAQWTAAGGEPAAPVSISGHMCKVPANDTGL